MMLKGAGFVKKKSILGSLLPKKEASSERRPSLPQEAAESTTQRPEPQQPDLLFVRCQMSANMDNNIKRKGYVKQFPFFNSGPAPS